MVPKNYTLQKKSPEKLSPEKLSWEKWSLEKYPPKIVLRQKNARKFERLLYFYRLIPLHTHKKMFDVHLTILHAPNCRILKESRKVCCRVLGFHRLISSQHSKRTPRRSTLTLRFFVSEFFSLIDWSHSNIPHTPQSSTFTPQFFRGLFLRGPVFRWPLFWGFFFLGTIFRDLFSGDFFPGFEKTEEWEKNWKYLKEEISGGANS